MRHFARVLVLALSLLTGLMFPASASAETWFVYCNLVDHGGKANLISGVFPMQNGNTVALTKLERDYVHAVDAKHRFMGRLHAYCYPQSSREAAETSRSKRIAETAPASFEDTTDLTTLPAAPQGSVWDAHAFMQEVIDNGVTKVHLMKTTGNMDAVPYQTKSESYMKRCEWSLSLIGGSDGRGARAKLDWTRAMAVKPFFQDPGQSQVAVIAPVTAREPFVGIVLDTGSEEMEARITKAMNVIKDDCAPKSHGF
ncbi:MAG: hypothetical protein B7Z26_03690 [Asticcacaulis sp. 32-58-5]|nr:MAG: hypothetical protein B7Z26_03690 [Asticcacaulis sp. 32-58-5]